MLLGGRFLAAPRPELAPCLGDVEATPVLASNPDACKLILFHQSLSRTFKAYYTEYVQGYLYSEFPTLVSYSHFVKLLPTILVLLGYCQLVRRGKVY